MYHFLQMPKAVSSLPTIERKKSRLHGFGVFALETINKNKRIIDYAGELISNKESEAREDRYLAKGCIWVFRVNRNWSRDAAKGGNVARFINHSCTAELLDRSRRQDQDDLGARREADSQGPGADLRLQHRGRQGDSLPVPAGMQDQAMKWLCGATATLVVTLAVCRARSGGGVFHPQPG